MSQTRQTKDERLVTDLIFHATAAAVVTAAVAGFFVWFWWGLPLLRRFQD